MRAAKRGHCERPELARVVGVASVQIVKLPKSEADEVPEQEDNAKMDGGEARM